MDTLAGRTVVVIGGSSGIGLAVAAESLAAGATVIVAGRSDARLKEASDQLGAGLVTRPVDATDEREMADLFAGIDLVDHIFVSVGVIFGGTLLEADMTSHRERLDSRVLAAAHAAKFGAPRMSRGGSITFTSGTGARRPNARSNPLASASAGAVESMSRTLAIQLAPIRVNTVVPGLVDTALTTPQAGPGREEALAAAANRLPVGRLGRPEDVAHAVRFIMENGYLTGVSLVLDGGGTLV